ncbi:MAG: aldose epimerase, partial [Actinomycetes bacterium]
MPHADADWPSTGPTEVVLRAGHARMAVDLRGGGPRRLMVGDWDVLDGYPSGTVPEGWRGAVLVPWPNRVRDGRWTWQGRDLQLDVSSPDQPHALHGLVAWQPWAVLEAAADTASVATVLEPHPGYPFRLAVAVDYVLTADRLTTTVRVRNPGPRAAPVAVGMHPYLHVGAEEDCGVGSASLDVGARTALETEGGLPTGRRTAFDGGVGRIWDRALDT